MLKHRFDKIWLFLLVCIPMCFSFLAWWVATTDRYQVVEEKFTHLTSASEKALQHRMDSYQQALLGGKGFFQGSGSVSRDEWRSYALALDIEKNFPGISGVGLIVNVPKNKVSDFIDQTRKGLPTFNARPKGDYPGQYLITFIEPFETNQEAVGLNIAFEEHRRKAADLATQTQRAAITQRILLVQDASQTPGFLLLLPIAGKSVNLEHVSSQFDAWIYAPFIAKNFMEDLTHAQGQDFRIEVFDEVESAGSLIYESPTDDMSQRQSRFVVEKTVEIMQQKWLIRWSSTQSFEASNISHTAFFVLICGLMFSILLGFFLIVLRPDSSPRSARISESSSSLLPVALFMILSSGTLILYKELVMQENERVNVTTLDQLLRFEAAFDHQYDVTVNQLHTAVNRWAAGGILTPSPSPEWDALFSGVVSGNESLEALVFLPFGQEKLIPVYQRRENLQAQNLVQEILDQELHRKHQMKPKAKLGSALFSRGAELYFLSLMPILSGEDVTGSLLVLFNVSTFVNPLLDEFDIPRSYSMQIGQGSEFVYFGAPSSHSNFSRVLTLDGASWVFAMESQIKAGNTHDQFLTKLILLVGLAISLLTSLVVYFAQKVRAASAIVQEKESFLSAFVQNVPMSVAMFDEQWRYIVASRRWFEFYNLPSSVVGRSHPVTGTPKWLMNDIDLGQDQILKMEEQVLHADGSLRAWMRYLVCGWADRSTGRQGIIVFAEDITEEKNMALMKNEFVSTVSHELRTPLTAIQGALGLLKMGSAQALELKYQKLLNSSYENCLNLTKIVNDILDLEKMAAGQLEYSVCVCDVSELMRESIELNRPYAQKYGVEVLFKTPDESKTIAVDPGRFKQCLGNLLSNAAKFSKPDSDICVRVSFNGSCKIEVEDFGDGMSLAFQKKIFQRFAQADGSSDREKGGTGLGLSITKTMVEGMGGQISFESTLGKGTCFYLEFPLYEDTAKQGDSSLFGGS